MSRRMLTSVLIGCWHHSLTAVVCRRLITENPSLFGSPPTSLVGFDGGDLIFATGQLEEQAAEVSCRHPTVDYLGYQGIEGHARQLRRRRILGPR